MCIMRICAPVRLTVTTCRLAQLPLLKDSAGTDSAAAPPAVAAAVALLPGSGTSASLIVMVSPASGSSSSLHGTLAFSALQMPHGAKFRVLGGLACGPLALLLEDHCLTDMHGTVMCYQT